MEIINNTNKSSENKLGQENFNTEIIPFAINFSVQITEDKESNISCDCGTSKTSDTL